MTSLDWNVLQLSSFLVMEPYSGLGYRGVEVRSGEEWFRDDRDRVIIPRGVNLGGTTKLPLKPLITTFHGSQLFFNHTDVSFVGRYLTLFHVSYPMFHVSPTLFCRPFPLDDAHTHLLRLKRWGLTFLRFLVTWEAIEHAGP